MYPPSIAQWETIHFNVRCSLASLEREKIEEEIDPNQRPSNKMRETYALDRIDFVDVRVIGRVKAL